MTSDWLIMRMPGVFLLPELLYKETGKLPMGCHAFDRKANIDFWKGIIGF